MTELSKKIIQKIDEENIQPYSKWHFLLKRSVIWIFFILSVLLGVVSSGVMIYQFQQTEWDLYSHYNHSIIEFMMLVIPYFWILILVLFSVLVFYYFRRVGRGYRRNTIYVVVISLILSLLGGILLSQAGFSEKVEVTFENRLPFYKGMIHRKRRLWNAPNRGLLAGKIIKINSDTELLIKDFSEEIWTVDISHTLIRGRMELQENRLIKIIGKITGKKSFTATEIRIWMGRGRRMRKKKKNRVPRYPKNRTF